MTNHEKDPDLKNVFATLAEDSTAAELDSAELAAWRDGSLPRAKSEKLLDSATQNAEITRLLLDTKGFPNLEPTTEEKQILEAFSKRKGWTDLQQKLPSDAKPLNLQKQESFFSVTSLQRYAAMIAVFLSGLILGSLWSVDTREPLVNTTLIEFTQIAETTRQNTKPEKSAPATIVGLELAFDVAQLTQGEARFAVSLFSENRKKIKSLSLVQPDETGIIRIVWPGTFEPGLYIVELSQGNKVVWDHEILLTH